MAQNSASRAKIAQNSFKIIHKGASIT